MAEHGMVYWITGLSGAGKTTIGKLFYDKQRALKSNIVFLDGDVLRGVFGDDLGYSREDRIKCARRYTNICALLSEQGIDVVICTISMFDEIRLDNRQKIKNYTEIYVKVNKDTLVKRNQKSLYSGAKNGDIANVMGVDIQEELPKSPDIVLENDGLCTPDELLNELIAKING